MKDLNGSGVIKELKKAIAFIEKYPDGNAEIQVRLSGVVWKRYRFGSARLTSKGRRKA